MMLHTKYQGSRQYGFRQEYFLCIPSIGLRKTCDPWGWAIIVPRGIIGTNLREVQFVMLHTKYQGSRRYGFRQEDFFMVFPV